MSGKAVEPMIYFLIGDDGPSKDAQIAELKKKFLPTPEAMKFDFELLHAPKLSPEDLKRAMVSLPAIAPQRVLVIRECHQLSPYNKDLVLDFVKDLPSNSVLILDSDDMKPSDDFFKAVGRKAKIMDFGHQEEINVFRLTDAIGRKRKTEALKILAELLDQGDHPLQIMGGLVWFWGTQKGRVNDAVYTGGLEALKTADLNIKRNRMKPEYAVEVAVMQLCA